MKYFLVAYFATWVFIPWILFSGKRPESTLAWVWAILLFPFFGPVAYLLFGVDRITRERARKRDRAGRAELARDQLGLAIRDEPLFRALAKLSDIPPSTASKIE